MKSVPTIFLLPAVILVFIAASWLTDSAADAATIVWTNTAGGDWSNPLNWSPNYVPGQLNALSSSDDVLITNAGTYRVILDVGTAPNFWDLRSLTLGGATGTQTLVMTNKILYVAPLTITNGGVLNNNGSSFHASIGVQNGGHLNSLGGVYYANPFSIGAGGVMNSTNDQIHAPLVVSNGAAFNTGGSSIEGDGSLELHGALTVGSGNFTLNGPATNSGAITVSSGAFLSVNSGLGLGGAGGIVNSPGGTITLASGNGIRSDNGAEYFLNQGTINGGGGYIQDVAHFTNAGAIDVSANTLTVNSDLNLQSGSSLNVQFNSASSYGRIVVSGNAALNGQFAVALGAGYNPQVGDTFQPLTYGTFSGGFTATNLPGIVPWQFSYGATAVTVQAQTESITWTNSAGGNWSDPNNWSPNQVPGGSTYGNADDVQITAPGSYTVVMDEGSRSAPYYVHTLTLGSGSDAPVLAVTNKWLDAGTLAVGSGAQINSSGSYWFNNWITPLEIQSGGVFDSSGDLFDQNVTVDSGGILAGVNSTNGNGSLAINGALDIPAGEFVLNSNGRATNSGAINISGGGNLVVNNTLALSGAGGIQNFPGGTITLSGGHGISSDNGAEYLANQGTLLSSGGYVLSVANFTNSGAITATTGTLNLDAGVHLNGTGSVNAQLNSTADYGKIAIAGNVALGGAFGVTLNYTPVGGDTFQPLTYGSSSGNFNSLNLPALGVGQTWETTLGATGLTLRVAQAITWTNTAGGNWSTAANWNPNQVPGQYDDVAITTPGTYTVTMDSATVNLHSLALGAGSGNGTQTLWMSAKTLYVNPCAITSGGILAENGSTFHSVIDVQGGGQLWSTNGTYYGPITVDSGGAMSANGYYAYDTFHGNVTVASGGLLTLATGQVLISNDGSLTVAASAEADVEGGCYIQLQGPLTNSGTLNLVGDNGNVSELLVYGGTSYNYQGGIWNLPGGTISLNGVANGYSTISGSGSGDYLINQGAVVVTYPGINIRVSQFDNSAGVVTNLAGVLSLSTLTNTLAGTFYAANGATIQLSGGDGTKPLLPGDPLLLNGPGQFRFISGWLDLPTNTIPNLQLTGGYLELGPSFQGGTITNLGLDGITLTNLSLPVTNGIFAVTNSVIYGNVDVQNGAELIVAANYGSPTFHGRVMVETNGLLWLAGGFAYVANDGSLTIQPGATANIQGGGQLALYAPMTNSGTVYLAGNNGGVSDLIIYNDGTASYRGGLWNLSAGTVSINGVANGYSVIQSSGQNTYLLNQGAIVVHPGSPACTIGTSVFDTGAGVVTNFSGTLILSTFTNTLAGTFYAASGSIIQLSGGTSARPLTPGVPLTLTGGGKFEFIGGWLDLPYDTISNLQLIGGVLELEPTFQGGAITNLSLDGIVLTNLSLAITNGTFAVTNSAVYGNGVVQYGGRWIATGNPVPLFHGRWEVQGGGQMILPGAWAEIANDGSLTIDAAGTVNIAGGAFLQLYGPMTNSGTVNLSGSGGGVSEIMIYNNGTAAYQGGLLNLPGGTINLNGVANNYSIVQSGTGPNDYFVNEGSLISSPGSPACIVNLDCFTNAGAIDVLNGTLQLNKIALQTNGSLTARLNSKTDYGKFTISGAATLNGAIAATLGGIYVPTNGTSFDLLSYGSATGSFTATNLPPLVAWQTTYNPTKVTILVTQTGLIPEFTTVVSVNGNLIFNGTNGAPGATYWVLESTNIAQPLATWTPVETNAFDSNGKFTYTNAPDPALPRQFFLLELP